MDWRSLAQSLSPLLGLACGPPWASMAGRWRSTSALNIARRIFVATIAKVAANVPDYFDVRAQLSAGAHEFD